MLERRLFHFTKRILKFSSSSTYTSCGLCLERHESTQSPRHLNLLKELSGCSDDKIIGALEKNRHVYLMSEEQIRRGVTTLEGLGIKANSRLDFLALLKHHLLTTRNRTMVLQEAGFLESKITAKLMEKYLVYSKLKVGMLKKKKLIEGDTDVTKHMLQYLDLPEDQKPTTETSDEEDVSEIKRKVLRIYLKWKLDLEEETMKDGGRLMYRMQNKSLRDMMRNIDIAERRMGITGNRLKKNWYLLFTDPDNSLDIFERLPEVAGVPIQEIVRTRPKIITCPIEHLLKIRQYLQEFDIPGVALMKRPEVLTLTSETVLRRLRELEKDEFFRLCLRHPRFLDLVYYHKKAVRRLRLLQEIKVHYASLHTIAAADKIFDRFYELGAERPRGIETQYYLCTELGISRVGLRALLGRQPYWVYIPVVEVAACLSRLLHLGFTKQEITEDIHIVFYPKEKVLGELEGLERRGEELDICREERPGGAVRRCLRLKLALYYMEREVNFTGEAVWPAHAEGSPPPPG